MQGTTTGNKVAHVSFVVRGIGAQEPPKITTTSLRPDTGLAMQATYERKRAKYHDLVRYHLYRGGRLPGFRQHINNTADSGCRNLHRASGAKPRRDTRVLAEEADNISFWLWVRRRDKVWESNGKGAAGRCLCHCSTTMRCSRVKESETLMSGGPRQMTLQLYQSGAG